MVAVEFRNLRTEDAAVLASWFSDAELARRVSMPDAAWMNYVLNDPVAHAWVGTNAAGEIICEVQVDQDPGGGEAFIEFYIRPDLRGQGLGAALLGAFIDGPGRRYQRFLASVAPDNAASLACARRCGFRRVATEADGLVWLSR